MIELITMKSTDRKHASKVLDGLNIEHVVVVEGIEVEHDNLAPALEALEEKGIIAFEKWKGY